MQIDEFGWDDDKAARNLRLHRVSFEQAAFACRDPFSVEWPDLSENYHEERWCLLGMYRHVLLFVVYTQRGDLIRIISARRAEKHEQDSYYRQNSS
jgi:uncharacterized DUF497 family protein